MATINFLYRSNREKAPLTLRLLHRNEDKDFTFSCKIEFEVEKSYWKNHKKNTRNVTLKNKQVEVNNELKKISSFILERFKTTNFNLLSNEWLKEQVNEYYNPVEEQSKSFDGIIQSIIDTAHLRDNGKGGVGLTKCRVNAYKRLQTLFNEFQKNKNYEITQLNKKVFDSFKKWLLVKKGYSPTYAFKKLSDLKTVCKDARSNGIEISADIDTIKTKQVSAYDDDMDVIILKPHELEKIEKATLTSDALINARKWLILACYTGQRGQALTTRIKKENFETYGSDLIIKIRQKKGNKSVIIPVLPKVKEIYENGMPYKISLTKLNKYFKEIGKIAELNEPVMGRITEVDENGRTRGIKKLRPKHKYISTHIGRRTFASNHYGKIPTPIIMKVTGHSKESTFLGYINQTDDSHIETFLDYYKTKELKESKEPQLKVLKNASNQ